MPFFKKEDNQILSGNWVLGAFDAYHLTEETKDNYQYPVDGWIYANDIDQAIAQFANLAKSTITNRQCKLALLSINKYQAVIDFIDSMSEPQKTQAKIEWDYANEIERDNPLFLVVAAGIGLTSSEVDDLFELAKTL